MFSVMSAMNSPWNELFPCPSTSASVVKARMREVWKQGRPLLLVSSHSGAAQAGVSLYAAQTTFALWAKRALELWVRWKIPFGMRKVDVVLDGSDPYVRFLSQLSGHSGIPPFSVLAGNPASQGQRFMVLVSRQDAGLLVAKTGVSDAAKALITEELKVLRWLTEHHVPGAPELVAEHDDSRVKCLVTEFIKGDSPRSHDSSEMPGLLQSWVRSNEVLCLKNHLDWVALLKAVDAHESENLRTLETKLSLAPALQHGDFAPWNIKMDPAGRWHVLDWERAQTDGLPAWDWFHYVTQAAILVDRVSIDLLLERIDNMLRSPRFLVYSAEAGLTRFERAWYQAYLLHITRVVRPAEGLAKNEELLRRFKV